MNVPPRHPALSFVLGLLIFVLAVSARWWFVTEHGLESAPPQDVWQVQGRGPVIQPPAATAQDRLVNNLKSQGVPAGFRTVNPLGPQREVPPKDPQKDKPTFEPVDEPVADLAPLYPLFRFGIEWTADKYHESFEMNPHAAVRMAQIALGSLTCVLYFVVALRAFGNYYLLAMLVGVATALYPFWVINTAELEDGTLVTFLLAWALALGVKIGQKGGPIRSYLFGLVLAGLALTRAALLPFAVVAQLWFFLRCRRVPHGGLCALLTLVGFGTGLTPWVLWSMQNHGEPIPVVSTAWFHLWIGNHPQGQGIPDDVAVQMADTPPAHRYERLAPVVLQEIEEHPLDAVKRRVRAVGQFFLGITYQRDHSMVRQATDSRQAAHLMALPPWLRPTLLFTLLGIYFLALLGWRWTYGWKHLSAPVMLALYWIPLPYILSYAGPLHSARLPLDGVFIVLAVVGLIGLLPGVGTRLLVGEERPVTK